MSFAFAPKTAKNRLHSFLLAFGRGFNYQGIQHVMPRFHVKDTFKIPGRELSVLAGSIVKTMKTVSMSALLIWAVLECTGCATLNAPPPAYSVSAGSTLVMATYFKYWPQMSGYYLPAGIYKAEKEDARGVFFKAPPGMKLLALTGDTDVEGGIYLPKSGSSGTRGHVYLRLPLLGWKSYFLPEEFFSHYGNTWRIEQSNEQLNTAPDPMTTSTRKSGTP